MQSPILPNGVSKTVTESPGESVSDSKNRCPPFTSMSNRCILRCFAMQVPSGSKTYAVLYTRSPSRSAIEPPHRYTRFSFASAERNCRDGPPSGSAKSGNRFASYGPFHISGSMTRSVPSGTVSTSSRICAYVSRFEGFGSSWMHASRKRFRSISTCLSDRAGRFFSLYRAA